MILIWGAQYVGPCVQPLVKETLCLFVFLSLQCEWLNNYHQTCRDVIGKELQKQGRQEALEWLLRETQPISKQH